MQNEFWLGIGPRFQLSYPCPITSAARLGPIIAV
jgi:hypothetical protein